MPPRGSNYAPWPLWTQNPAEDNQQHMLRSQEPPDLNMVWHKGRMVGLMRYLDDFHEEPTSNPPPGYHVVRQEPLSRGSVSTVSSTEAEQRRQRSISFWLDTLEYPPNRDEQQPVSNRSRIVQSQQHVLDSSNIRRENRSEPVTQPIAAMEGINSGESTPPERVIPTYPSPVSLETNQLESLRHAGPGHWPGYVTARDQRSLSSVPLTEQSYSNMVPQAPVESEEQLLPQPPAAPGYSVPRPLRQDPPPYPDQASVDRMKRMKLCNSHFLLGNCMKGSRCRHNHTHHGGYLYGDELEALRTVARMAPCKYGTACNKQDCIYGHRCPAGSPNRSDERCAYGASCRFRPDMH